MTEEISIDNIVFMTDDPNILIEGVKEYREKFEKGKKIEPIDIFHQDGNTYYARGGRHRTYFFYHFLNKDTIPSRLVKNPKLTEYDLECIKNGGITVHDLVVHSIKKYHPE